VPLNGEKALLVQKPLGKKWKNPWVSQSNPTLFKVPKGFRPQGNGPIMEVGSRAQNCALEGTPPF